MMLIDFVFAFFIALALSGILAAHSIRRGVRQAGGWPVFLFLFLLLLLMTWAGGVWMTSFGPVLWGSYWLPFLSVAIIVALLLAALLPPAHPPRTAGEALQIAHEREAASLVLGTFFWMVLAVLAVSIAIHYFF